MIIPFYDKYSQTLILIIRSIMNESEDYAVLFKTRCVDRKSLNQEKKAVYFPRDFKEKMHYLCKKSIFRDPLTNLPYENLGYLLIRQIKPKKFELVKFIQ